MFTRTAVPAARFVLPERLKGVEPGRFPTIVLAGPDAAGPGGVGPSVVLDYGAELHGGFRVEVVAVDGDEPRRLRVRLGESVSEALAGGLADGGGMVREGSALELGPTGFRFARVDVDGASARVEVATPQAYSLVRDAPRLGSFACDDPVLNRVWEVGARTAHLCMQGHVWDGIKRGRTVWAGDLHPASNAIQAAFGPQPVVAASLDHLRDRTPAADWMNGIPAYSLWWVVCQAEGYLYGGDLGYLGAQRGYLSALVDLLADEVDADGRERYLGWRYFDWATTRDFDAIHAGYQGLTAWALRSARGIAEALGDRGLAARSGEVLARVGSYRPPATANKQARALLVLGGLDDAVSTNREVLAVDPAEGLTPFLGYHVLEARALAGDLAGALDLIRGYWGAMIGLGATTFWEDFDLDWVAGSAPIDEAPRGGLRDLHAGLGRNAQRGLALSLCHAWSAGPTAWLSRHVLGVRPLEPGCRAVAVRAGLGDLGRAEGGVPTPLGVVRVRHRRRPDGTVATDVDAPDAIRVVVEGPGSQSVFR